MKERLQTFVMSAWVALLFFVPLYGWTQVTIGDFTYTFSGTEATITATSLTGGTIIFPEKVIYDGTTYDVTEISYGNQFIKGSPEIVSGISIKRITGGYSSGVKPSGRFATSCSQLKNVIFPNLEELKSSAFLVNADALEHLLLPELRVVENSSLLDGSTSLISISLHKLERLTGNECFVKLAKVGYIGLTSLKVLGCTYSFADNPSLHSLVFPALTTMIGSANYSFNRLPKLITLSMNALKEMPRSQHAFYDLASLETLGLPALEEITGSECFNNMPSLTLLSFPSLTSINGTRMFRQLSSLRMTNWMKLKSVSGREFMTFCRLNGVEFPTDCIIESENGFAVVQGDTVLIKGKPILSGANLFSSSSTLKVMSFPDIVSIGRGTYTNIGSRCPVIREFDAPELRELYRVSLFTDTKPEPRNDSLRIVNIPKLSVVNASSLFIGATIQSLTVSGSIRNVNNSGEISLFDYPTVVYITDADSVYESTLFDNVRGGRFIAPRGKAALYATKWKLPLDRTMIYSPVRISKSTDGDVYASGSIFPSEGEFIYDGTSYVNQYDLYNAMTAAECLNPEIIGPNDLGYTPSLSTLTASDYTSPFSNLEVYYISSYKKTNEENTDTLTLSSMKKQNRIYTSFYYIPAAAKYSHKGIGTEHKGFLFRGNKNAITELYLPYVETPFSFEGNNNYLEAGKGNAVTSRTEGDIKCYWHPGNVTYSAGFYECDNTLIPEGRAYLSIPRSMASRANGFKFVFGNETVTNISTIKVVPTNSYSTSEKAGWYTLQGVRLPNKPTQAGVYLHNGQKIVIR